MTTTVTRKPIRRTFELPKYFVCEPGPMGGVHIIFVAAEFIDVERFVNSDATKDRTLTIFQQVPYDRT